MGDFDRLQQIIWNLLSNAIKFTPAGGQVSVRTVQVGSQVEIQISDSGRGIKPEFLPFVFDRFRQEDATTRRQDGGLGLGLAIVRQLVELHGGTARVESEGEGRGATFVITLPLREFVAVAAGVVRQQASRSGAASTGNDLSGRISGVRILVVDDDSDALALIQVILEGGGAEVRTVHSAAECYSLLGRWKPDVMFVDIGMPNEDGYDLIRRLRALSAQDGGLLPAVALTAYSCSEDRIRALASGYQMHVAKPVEPEELLTIVATLTGR
jgi:CheY-like chemotaxis protein/anti-sigma regulatory factor (Ser/Thr protein kinase)